MFFHPRLQLLLAFFFLNFEMYLLVRNAYDPRTYPSYIEARRLIAPTATFSPRECQSALSKTPRVRGGRGAAGADESR